MNDEFDRYEAYTNDKRGYRKLLDKQPNKNLGFVLPIPHYSEPRWNEAQTVWGSKADVKGFTYNYDDRLWQWDSKSHDAAVKIANEKHSNPPAYRRTAGWVQDYLSAYHNKKVTLYHILAGVNVSNGYHYYAFGYVIHEEAE